MQIRRGVFGLVAMLCATPGLSAQTVDPGRKAFESRCATCHGADGNGGEMGPPIALRLPPLSDPQLTKLIREGIPAKGMPPQRLAAAELAAIVKFARTIQRHAPPVIRRTVQTTDGRTLEGQLLGEGLDDL